MSLKAKKHIYFTPAILFVLLATFFVAVGAYLHEKESAIERNKAENLSTQVVYNLQSMAEERHRAIESLTRDWPTQQPNYLDWFNVRAISLLNIQSGYSSIMYIDRVGIVQWLVRANRTAQHYWQDNIVGAPLGLTELLDDQRQEAYFNRLVSANNGRKYLLYGRLISPQEPWLGYVLATFDLHAWLAESNGQLIEQHYHFVVTDKTYEMVTVGTNAPADIIDFPIESPSFSLLGRTWVLKLTTHSQLFSGGVLVALVGLNMSLLATVVLFQFLKSAVSLSQSQRRFQTASEAALDGLLIYTKTDGEYFLAEANKIAYEIFQGDVCLLKGKSLYEQLNTFHQGQLVSRVKELVATGEAFDDYIEIKSRLIKPRWLKVQIVRADQDIAITVRDVTARFQAEQALLKSEEKYRRLIDGLYRHFVYTKTLDHDFVYVSQGVHSILGMHADDFCRIQRKCVQDSVSDPSLKVDAIRMGNNPEPYRLKLLANSGETKVIEFADTGVFDGQGKLIAIEGIARDVTEEFALQQEVTYQASHDQLTGLMNRYAFDNYLTQLISRINAGEASAVMCFIDMDRFKLVNDSCGHPAGDRLLKEVANLFGEFVSEHDLLARIGGDEFCVIFQNLTLEQVLKKLDLLIQQVTAYRFLVEDKVFFVGASIGVIDIQQQGYSVADLVKAADNACYKAKSLGRNRYFVYTPTEEQQSLDQAESKLLQHLQLALENSGFELFFQPILDLQHQRKTIHGEVLLRLLGDDGHYVSPAAFIPLAEQHGIMNKIDWWVVSNTLEFLQKHREFCRQLDKIAINLSGITLSDEKRLKQIVHKVQCSNLPAEKLCFEITETAAVTNLTSAKWFIDELRSLGCRFALDDFGAGMSSFTYLKNLDVDFVKIDGSFVRNMVRDKIDYETVKAINNIAQSMGKQTIAEFVVDDATRNALVELGIDYGQGYALGYPEPLKNRSNTLQLVG